MAVIGRQYIFIPGNRILAEEWNGELDQLYRFLNGQLSANVIFGQTTVNSNLIVENIRLGETILQFNKGNLPVLQFLVTTQVKSLVTLVAPFVVESTTKVDNLNANYLDGRPSSSFLSTGRKVRGFIPIDFGALLPVAVTDKANNYVVGQVTNGSLLSVKYSLFPNILVAEAEVNFNLKKNGVIIDADVLMQDGVAEPTITKTLNVAVVDGDLLSMAITSVTLGTGIQQPTGLAARIEFEQDLIT